MDPKALQGIGELVVTGVILYAIACTFACTAAIVVWILAHASHK